VHSTVCTVQCAQYSVHSTLCTVQCAQYIVHSTLCTVQSTDAGSQTDEEMDRQKLSPYQAFFTQCKEHTTAI